MDDDKFITTYKGHVQTCITSPPYFNQRKYTEESVEIGLEYSVEAYIANLTDVFDSVKTLLNDDGILWVNIGDKYKNGELMGIPWLFVFQMKKAGWKLRRDIIWAKGTSGLRREGSVMPESVKDRATTSHEYIFMFVKQNNYFYDYDAVKEVAIYPAGTKAAKGSSKRGSEVGVNSRPAEYKVYDGFGNMRSVWRYNVKPTRNGHFASYPEELITPMILASTKPGQIVFDPFMGSGTTAVVAKKLGREYLGCELNPGYMKIAEERLKLC